MDLDFLQKLVVSTLLEILVAAFFDDPYGGHGLKVSTLLEILGWFLPPSQCGGQSRKVSTLLEILVYRDKRDKQ